MTATCKDPAGDEWGRLERASVGDEWAGWSVQDRARLDVLGAVWRRREVLEEEFGEFPASCHVLYGLDGDCPVVDPVTGWRIAWCGFFLVWQAPRRKTRPGDWVGEDALDLDEHVGFALEDDQIHLQAAGKVPAWGITGFHLRLQAGRHDPSGQVELELSHGQVARVLGLLWPAVTARAGQTGWLGVEATTSYPADPASRARIDFTCPRIISPVAARTSRWGRP